jgi:multidrug resistance efflux pump
VLALLAISYAASHGVSQDKQAGKEKSQAPAGQVGKDEGPGRAATCKVEKGPFKVEVTLKGILEAEAMTPLALNLEAWTPQAGGAPLTVAKAVEAGTRVRKGDPLVWIDLDAIDRAIRDLEAERHLSELAIQLIEKELPTLEKSVPVDLAAAERAKKVADEDLEKFLKEDRAFTEKTAEFSVKSARQWLEYEQEELRQLEKMYKANDLTEETEEIILKRQRFFVEQADFFLKMAERRRNDTLQIDLPRRDQLLRESATKQTLARDRARATMPLTLSQKQLTLNKMRYDRDKATERLAKLKRDREAMTLKTPADGIVYYGRCLRGQWTTAAATADKLQPGGQLQPKEVILTIVQPKGLFVRAEVEEKELHHLRAGMTARVIATARPDGKLPATIESLSAVPVTPGKFLARVAVTLPQEDHALMPGMTCTVKLVPYLKAEALTVPAAAIFADELDEERHYVSVMGAGHKPLKRYVKVGKKTDQKAEILEGLKEGEEILREKPAAGPKATSQKAEGQP